jgi:hypothetical protein
MKGEMLMRVRYLRRVLVLVGVVCVVPLVSLGMATPAMASPKGIFSVFSDCPLKLIKELGVPLEDALCQYGVTTSGEFAIGETKVPINQTITLQGGAVPISPGNESEFVLLPAADGNSLSKTELNVPGGLLDLVNCEAIKGSGIWEIIERGACKAIFENKTTGVTATTELVANTHNPALLNLEALGRETGTAITLPVRVHLKNPLLGNSCYVGSEASPIQLHLTTGSTSPNPPNKSIKGALGNPETLEEKGLTMLRLSKNSLVDNAFSVPVAEGCGEFFSFIIDPIVDSKLKLPSADGNNTAILNGTLNTANAENVTLSEAF